MVDDGDRVGASVEQAAVVRLSRSRRSATSARIWLRFGPQPHRRPARRAIAAGAGFGLAEAAREIVGLDGGEQLALTQPQSQERAEIALRAGIDFALPLGDQIAMVVLRDRVGEFDCKAVPDALIIGDAQVGLFPDFRPLAAIRRPAPQSGLTLSFSAPAAVCVDRALELDAARTLLEIVPVVQAAGWRRNPVRRSKLSIRMSNRRCAAAAGPLADHRSKTAAMRNAFIIARNFPQCRRQASVTRVAVEAA